VLCCWAIRDCVLTRCAAIELSRMVGNREVGQHVALTFTRQRSGACGCGPWSRPRMDGQKMPGDGPGDAEMGEPSNRRVAGDHAVIASRVKSAVPQSVWRVSGSVAALDVSRSSHTCAAANASTSARLPDVVVAQRLQATSKRSPVGRSREVRSPADRAPSLDGPLSRRPGHQCRQSGSRQTTAVPRPRAVPPAQTTGVIPDAPSCACQFPTGGRAHPCRSSTYGMVRTPPANCRRCCRRRPQLR
jgi:hypothetical protein